MDTKAAIASPVYINCEKNLWNSVIVYNKFLLINTKTFPLNLQEGIEFPDFLRDLQGMGFPRAYSAVLTGFPFEFCKA
jgi:hypothetical protein